MPLFLVVFALMAIMAKIHAKKQPTKPYNGLLFYTSFYITSNSSKEGISGNLACGSV